MKKADFVPFMFLLFSLWKWLPTCWKYFHPVKKKAFTFFQGVGSGSAPTCGNYFLFFAHFFLENRPILHVPLVKKADFAPNIQKQDSKRTGCIHLLGVARVPTRALLLRVPSFSLLLRVCYPTLLFTYRMLPAAPPLCFVACRGPTGSRTPSRS